MLRSAAASFPAAKAACIKRPAEDVPGCGSGLFDLAGVSTAFDVDGWGSTGEVVEDLLAASEAAIHCLATFDGEASTFLCLKLDCSADFKLLAAFHFFVGIGSANATFPDLKVLPPSVENAGGCLIGESSGEGSGELSEEVSVSSFGNGLCDGDDGSEIDDLVRLGVSGHDPEV